MKQEEKEGKFGEGLTAGNRVAAKVLGVTEFSERAKLALKSQLPDRRAAVSWPLVSCKDNPELAKKYKEAGEKGYQEGLADGVASAGQVDQKESLYNSPSIQNETSVTHTNLVKDSGFGPIYHFLP